MFIHLLLYLLYIYFDYIKEVCDDNMKEERLLAVGRCQLVNLSAIALS